MYEPIENYGIIGDLHTVALISLKGSLDFMCFTRFDSPTVFASLLDEKKGGSFSINPLLDKVSYKQLYLPDTAILLTRFFAYEGIAELTDFMPVRKQENHCSVIRMMRTIRGKINYRMECAPRFNYSLSAHKTEKEAEGLSFISNDQSKARLLSNIPLQISSSGFNAVAEFTLEEGERAFFVFEAVTKEPSPESLKTYIEDSYRETIKFWKDWIAKSKYEGRWREIVNRSALTLKLLTSNKYGSPIAAATFGLPEVIGGSGNWDYRYTWIRDAAFTMYAFLRLGFLEEAAAFVNWIKDRARTDLQLMYAVDGGTDLEEKILDHFEGYKGSKPVRVGNGAHHQFQLDIYGELIDTIYLYNKDGGAITYEFWEQIEQQVNFVIDNWKKPDHGIWEVRSNKYELLHSRMMCWVAIDRAIKIAINRSFPCPIMKWHDVRDEIFKDVFNNFWNEEKKSFVQHKGTTALDASILLMPLMRILSPQEERWKSTLEAVEKELRLDVLIYRYKNKSEKTDGISGEEGTFTMCSFWYVECLAKAGQIEKAREYFEKMLGYANHLGLFSEQLGARGEHLGNFPQAFTHLALISAAFELNRDIK